MLTNICKTYRLSILNGRFLGDSQGYFTFFNTNGSSTVDYILASSQLYHKVEHFNVLPPTEISDHCLITANIHMNIDVLCNEKYKTCFLKGKYLWSSICKNKYADALMEEDTKNQILMLDNLLDQVKDDKSYDPKNLVETLSNIMINAANKSVPFKTTIFTKKKRQKIKPKPQWMSKDCSLFRKEVRNLGKNVQKYPNNCELRHAFVNCRKTYNKLRTSLKSNFYNYIADEINSLSPQNSNKFWNKIKENKVRKTNAENIGISEFVDHYKTLLNIHYTDEESSKYNYAELNMEPKPLDFLFTQNEIKQSILKLKNGKSAGPDLNLNEFIKTNHNILLPTLTNLLIFYYKMERCQKNGIFHSLHHYTKMATLIMQTIIEVSVLQVV